MRLWKIYISLLSGAFYVSCNTLFDREVFNYDDIAGRLYSFEYLSEYPEAEERSGNFSSYDRASVYNQKTGQYENWHANADGKDGYLRREGSDIVALELDGPGVIWRVWSAQPKEGSIKIFIDGETDPVLDMPFIEYFNSDSGLFAYPALVYKKARGYNNYVPVSFQKSCKITFGEGWGRFFQFTYTKFGKKVKVPSFRGSFNAEEREILARSNLILSGHEKVQYQQKESVTVEKNVEVAPGATIRVCRIEGEKAIHSMRVRLNLEEGEDTAYILRELALSISWDNEPGPGVWSPLGDFFGSAPGINNYESLPMGMTNEGFYSNWFMPFAENATIELSNDGEKTRNVNFQVSYVPLKKPADKLLRFHSKWHRDVFPGVDKEKYTMGDRWPDWPFLITSGTGRFCGVCLNVWNPNPKGKIRKKIPAEELGNVPDKIVFFNDSVLKKFWWGEGDEKFFVDGENFPSTFGTGTEDYFGFAWCTPECFQSAFQNQTRNISNTGHVSVNRFQIADNVPFRSSFEGCLEKYHPNEWPLLYFTVSYWYLEAGGIDPYGPVDLKDRLDYFVIPASNF